MRFTWFHDHRSPLVYVVQTAFFSSPPMKAERLAIAELASTGALGMVYDARGDFGTSSDTIRRRWLSVLASHGTICAVAWITPDADVVRESIEKHSSEGLVVRTFKEVGAGLRWAAEFVGAISARP